MKRCHWVDGYVYLTIWTIPIPNSSSNHRIGGLVVKLAVATLYRTVSASPGFDSRPMHFGVVE
jgi:hypothetical protein